MSPAQQTKLLLLGLAEYLQVTLSPEQLVMYAAEFPSPEQLAAAIKRVKADPEIYPGRFPLPARLHAYLSASRASDAKEAVALIFECIMEFGPSRQAEAKLRMGDFAWSVCKRYGGFGNLCNMESREKSTVYAQLRDMAANMLERRALGLGKPELTHEEREDAPRAAKPLAAPLQTGAGSLRESLLKVLPKQDT